MCALDLDLTQHPESSLGSGHGYIVWGVAGRKGRSRRQTNEAFGLRDCVSFFLDSLSQTLKCRRCLKGRPTTSAPSPLTRWILTFSQGKPDWVRFIWSSSSQPNQVCNWQGPLQPSPPFGVSFFPAKTKTRTNVKISRIYKKKKKKYIPQQKIKRK